MTVPRLRRDDPLDIVRHLIGMGARHATSLGEARAAASIDSRLRRDGMQVSADTFRAATGTGWTYPLLVLLAALAALVALWLPLLALLITVYCLLLSVSDTFAAPLPGLARSRDSQNIVATRARAGAEDPAAPLPSWRVVLLAPLDSPWQTFGGWYCAPRHLNLLIGRMLALSILLLLCVLLLFAPRSLWQGLLLVPVGYLCYSLLPRPAATDQASLAGGSGALAVLLAASERLGALQGVEIWTVALGATTTGSSGLQDLLARYPFPAENTLFLVLPNIAGEQLFYAPSEGVLRQYTADLLLLQLAEHLSEKDPLVSISPRSYYSASSIATVLHSRGYRALTIHTCGSIPHRIPADDEELAATFNYHMLEQAIRLIVGMVRLLNQDERTYERRQGERRSSRPPLGMVGGYERRQTERRQGERRRG